MHGEQEICMVNAEDHGKTLLKSSTNYRPKQNFEAMYYLYDCSAHLPILTKAITCKNEDELE